ncbi:MAG: cation:proton antiporter [Crocinitomicaceae bacterium]|nr:cation:proton antiporter [Crocinitomicaceae bacterium]MDG1776185.1 cation:proton antiporter [Crocinitomicaceae bacterium]
MNSYVLIIALAGIIILSFFFNIISKKTNIPAVLLLIGLGMGIKGAMNFYGLIDADLKLNSLLEILGNIGLVMIVLEAALDLKLEKKKIGLIVRSFVIASLGLVGSMFALAGFFMYIFPNTSLHTAAVYALPLSIMSSAIIIPSVGRLTGEKREFMVYESTFSDILGIMVFYFMIGAEGNAGEGDLFWDVVTNVGGTVILSVVVAYVMVYLFQHLTMQVKLFLIIAVLLLLFAIGKYFHLSSLLIILAFGIVLNNTDVFFRGKLAKLFDKEKMKPILHDFHILTLESAFLIRTFFFVVFGLSISVASLYNVEVAINSLAIVSILYAVRYVFLRVFAKKFLFPELFIAPRGLITVLLFFVLIKHDTITISNFDTGLLLYPILITSMVMMFALISYRGENVKDVILNNIPLLKNKELDSVKNDSKEELNEANEE